MSIICVFGFRAGEEHPGEAARTWMKVDSQSLDESEAHRGETIIVMVDGNVIFERYDNGGSAGRVQMLASDSKSFVGVAAVAAVQDDIIKLDDHVSASITE